ncbi:hypothetical protein JCM19300_635 [Algibacter lectus]|uniref:Uncharacterized protein n=1 Tax=Algibacter lectus TaxID=221126 RepID=A0A090VEU6_9FLAO|nr:hypothetical protein JCM19300_635 [Algibacter lectus]
MLPKGCKLFFLNNNLTNHEFFNIHSHFLAFGLVLVATSLESLN